MNKYMVLLVLGAVCNGLQASVEVTVTDVSDTHDSQVVCLAEQEETSCCVGNRDLIVGNIEEGDNAALLMVAAQDCQEGNEEVRTQGVQEEQCEDASQGDNFQVEVVSVDYGSTEAVLGLEVSVVKK